MIFTEGEPFIMNKKMIVIGALQFFFLFLGFFVLYMDTQFQKDLDTKTNENMSLREQIGELETEYASLKEASSDEENVNVETRSIKSLEEEQIEKENQIKELEEEIKTTEEVKEDWNKRIAELEK